MDVHTEKKSVGKSRAWRIRWPSGISTEKNLSKLIGFLRNLKRDADRSGMTESSLYLALPYMLRSDAQFAFEAAQDDASSRPSIQDWTAAYGWLLRTFKTNANIADARMDPIHTRRSTKVDETKFSTRARNAFKRCGNVHFSYEADIKDSSQKSLFVWLTRYRPGRR